MVYGLQEGCHGIGFRQLFWLTGVLKSIDLLGVGILVTGERVGMDLFLETPTAEYGLDRISLLMFLFCCSNYFAFGPSTRPQARQFLLTGWLN